MKQDDIQKWAKDAGLQLNIYVDAYPVIAKQMMKFANLVAAAEREACAKVAAAYEPTCDVCPSGVSNAIRARGDN